MVPNINICAICQYSFADINCLLYIFRKRTNDKKHNTRIQSLNVVLFWRRRRDLNSRAG